MIVYEVFQFACADAFHLAIAVDLKKGNSFFSTIPKEYVERVAQTKIQNLKNEYIPNEYEARKKLREIGNLVLGLSKSRDFFYPSFLLENGLLKLGTAPEIMSKYETLHLWPRTHYSYNCYPLDFYIMTCLLYHQQNKILQEENKIELKIFEDYILNKKMQEDYLSFYSKRNLAYTIIEEQELRFLLLVSEQKKLLMVISL